ncbi:MAG: hypothetical protein H0X65_18640 [Gemmatimonadetes bacterium]|nr:hypothetical protein [Gemmatimonadota bacterium]
MPKRRGDPGSASGLDACGWTGKLRGRRRRAELRRDRGSEIHERVAGCTGVRLTVADPLRLGTE